MHQKKLEETYVKDFIAMIKKGKSSNAKSVPTQRSQDIAYVLSGKMMARHLAWVQPTSGILRDF